LKLNWRELRERCEERETNPKMCSFALSQSLEFKGTIGFTAWDTTTVSHYNHNRIYLPPRFWFQPRWYLSHGNTIAVVVDNRDGIIALNFKNATAFFLMRFSLNCDDILSWNVFFLLVIKVN